MDFYTYKFTKSYQFKQKKVNNIFTFGFLAIFILK